MEGQGRYKEATDLNREIYLNTLRYQPEIAAQALYRSAFCYEAMGDDLKAVAALLDAKKLSQHLPAELAMAEIPAKLSAIYARQDREKEALAYLNEAEKGLAKVMQEKGTQLNKTWLAETYFKMGSISTNQLTKDNFSSFSQGQMWVQSYLIKAMKLEDPVWSARAQQKLIETYRSLFQVLESTKGDLPAQVQMGGDIFDLMDQAELYKPMTGEKIQGFEKDFFAALADIRTKSGQILYGAKETTGLTVESQRLNGLRRAGRVKADQLLPGEKKATIPLPPKIVPTEDPNL
jgi:tetratricopeptide (TPR) repeat protein